jgi:arginase
MGLDIRVITTTNVSGTQHSRDPAAAAAMTHGGESLLSAALMRRLAESAVRVDEVVTVHVPKLPDAEPVEALASINARIAETVANALSFEICPVLVGGNCSHIIGMIGGIQAALGATVRLGLLWLDAHGDFNTPRTSLSGMYGGMPVAVAAGLCLPEWREGGGQQAPLPTNRIVMVDVRNLDEAEEALIRATDVEIARFGEGFASEPVFAAIDRLAERCDHIYVHVDADILDASLQPNHPTVEPNGPDLGPVLAVLGHVFGTGKVQAFAVVSVNPSGEQGAISVASGSEMLAGGLRAWAESRA